MPLVIVRMSAFIHGVTSKYGTDRSLRATQIFIFMRRSTRKQIMSWTTPQAAAYIRLGV